MSSHGIDDMPDLALVRAAVYADSLLLLPMHTAIQRELGVKVPLCAPLTPAHDHRACGLRPHREICGCVGRHGAAVQGSR
jgi:hypothetical protein